MAFPPQVEVTDGYLVFRELAHPDVLADADKLFEHVCFIACTNAFRPLGAQEIDTHELPNLEPGEYRYWGGARFDADDVDRFRGDGYVLAEIRLPAQPMGAPIPPGALQERPSHTLE